MRKLTITIVLTFCLAVIANAQVPSNSATRTDEKIFKFNNKTGQVIINAERGQISIQSWEKNEVSVRLVLVAKNKDAAIAGRELEYMKYNLVKNRDNIFLNNKMVLPDGKKELASIVSARYEIFVPKNADIVINNKYGRVTFKNCSGIVNGDLDYTDLLVSDFSGIMNIRQTVGDISCLRSSFKGSLRIKHVNADLQELSGKLVLNSDFGKIQASPGNGLLQLDLTSHATDIIFKNSNCLTTNISIDGSYCSLDIDRACYLKNKFVSTYKPDQEQEEWMFRCTTEEKSSALNIKANFGSISLM